MDFSKITRLQKVIAAVLFIGIVCLILYFVMTDTPPPKRKPTPIPRKTTPPKTTTPPDTLTLPPPPPPKTTPPPALAKMEVYFADKASDYTISSLEEANAYAVSLGGILADPSHLRDALNAGLDVCRFGRASNGLVYTATIGYHGYESGCVFGENGGTVGLKSYLPAPEQKTGVWVYGVKPSVYERCGGGVIPCVLPFSTVTKQWSQYSNTLTDTPPPALAQKEIYFADKASDYTISSQQEAIDFAVSLGGVVASQSQLSDALNAGLNVCRFGRASDGYLSTVTTTDHGPGSGCEFSTQFVSASGVGLKTKKPAAEEKAGVWVYGVKPSDSLLCKPSGVIPCILPFSTVTNQWSQYSPPPPTPPPPPAAKTEVYFADGGSDYTFSTSQAAADHAQSLGGTVATPSQLRDALAAGLDICRFGWSTNGQVYTLASTDHGEGSGCRSLGLQSFLMRRPSIIAVYDHNGQIIPPQIPKAGVWVYGVKPSFSDSLLCKPNGVIPCIYPLSTKTNKWSQYS